MPGRAPKRYEGTRPKSVLATAHKNRKSCSWQLAIYTDIATQLTGFIAVVLQNTRDPQWEGVIDGEVCGLGPIAKSVQTFLHWVAIKLETTDALRLCVSCGDALAREVSGTARCFITLSRSTSQKDILTHVSISGESRAGNILGGVQSTRARRYCFVRIPQLCATGNLNMNF